MKTKGIKESLKKGEAQEEKEAFFPSDKHIEVVNRVYKRFEKMRDKRDESKHIFDGRTLEQYIDDNVDQYNGIVPDDIKGIKEDWQSLAFDHITRGKVKTLLALTVGKAPYINIIGEKEQDEAYASQIKKINDFEWRRLNGYYQSYLEALEAVVKGTVVVEEKYTEQEVKIKEVSNVNHKTGAVSYREKTGIKGGYGHVESEIVPLLNFYPNENYAEIKGDCIKFDFLTIDEFQKRFGKYKNSEAVGSGINIQSYTHTKYSRIAQDDNDIVEILYYYNEDDDEFIILANGIWINAQGEEEDICPLPFLHKSLPFAKTVFELADITEFYGKSLPDIMSGEQETINALLRALVDREVLSLNKPILAGFGAEIESYMSGPGTILSTTGDIDQIREMNISDSSQAPFSLLEFLVKRSNVNTAIDPMAAGVSTGGRKTAKEATLLDENSKEMASSFQLFFFKLLLEKAKLRISNIQQFYTKPIQYSPVIDRETGVKMKDQDGKDVTLPEYRTIFEERPGKEPVWMKVDPKIKRANVVLRLEEDFYQSKSQMDRKEKAQALLNVAMSNPLLDADEVTIEWLIAWGNDPKRFYKGMSEQEQTEMQRLLGAQGQPMEKEAVGQPA